MISRGPVQHELFYNLQFSWYKMLITFDDTCIYKEFESIQIDTVF